MEAMAPSKNSFIGGSKWVKQSKTPTLKKKKKKNFHLFLNLPLISIVEGESI